MGEKTLVQEKIVIGAGTKYPLNGMLTIPENTAGPVPAVVLVHGSGPSNMDGNVGNNYVFRDFAEGLAERGIAAIRYDKRTFVYGKEMKHDGGLSVKEETIEDAVLAAELLRNDSRIDRNKIFIIGHSMGGMLAPRIDSEGGNFTGIIIMAGSPRTLEEIMMSQNDVVLDSLNRFVRFIAKKQIAALASKFENIYHLSDEQAKSTPVMGKHLMAYYFKEAGEHPSSQYLKDLDKPIFIMQGEKDVQASLEKDFNGYKSILGDKPNVTYKLYSNLNHLMMPSIYGELLKVQKEYKIAQKVDQQVISDIADWILAV
ncbi:S9 family peptidase [Neobacillus niacini]|uniref:alpha/beta hydrolase family protein n=1 Tax=Neobacillus niacini TaxID=86668 RepID=UPI0021CB6AF8|nr:alpha/beta fold hydrolase [Neobacillus niacini]MCM3766039.1 alpha/beta fold hydrolase [Neobacillus niacini]